MNTSKENTGGILKGLKRLIFSEEPELLKDTPLVENKPLNASQQAAAPIEGTVDQNTKLKVYQLLEGLNKPGCDFFEVWNASIEMGGATPNNIRSAYTSLKFADATLTKAKLEETGNYYIAEIDKVLVQETQKRKAEIDKLEIQKTNSKESLSHEIASLETQIAALQEKLSLKKVELDNINQNFDPQIEAIHQRISIGEASVNSVIQEMKQVLQIINQEIK